MQAYVARPKEEKKYPAVVVIHENRGLNAHIEDVARRAAKAGYLAVAPNALSPLAARLRMRMTPVPSFSNWMPRKHSRIL